jgi:hypothetical protein
VNQDQTTVTWLFCDCGVACSDITERERERLATERKPSSSVSAVTDWTAGELGFVAR